MLPFNQALALRDICRQYGSGAADDVIDRAAMLLEAALRRDPPVYREDVQHDLDRLEAALRQLGNAVDQMHPRTLALLQRVSWSSDRRIEEIRAAEAYPPRSPEAWPRASWAAGFDLIDAVDSRFPGLLGHVERSGRRRPGIIDRARDIAVEMFTPSRAGRPAKVEDEMRQFLVYALGDAFEALTAKAPGYSRAADSSGPVHGDFPSFVADVLRALSLTYSARTLTEDASRAFAASRD